LLVAVMGFRSKGDKGRVLPGETPKWMTAKEKIGRF